MSVVSKSPSLGGLATGAGLSALLVAVVIVGTSWSPPWLFLAACLFVLGLVFLAPEKRGSAT
jgi:uncharacterized membrane protein YccC